MGQLTISYNNDLLDTDADGNFTLSTNGKVMTDDVGITFNSGSALPTWTLLGEYDFDTLRGENATWGGTITLSDLGGLTHLYFLWQGIANTSSSASGLTAKVNDVELGTNWLIPSAKSGSSINGYTHLTYNGLTWEIFVSPGNISATSFAKGNAQTAYNERFNVGACNTLTVSTGVATYNPDRGLLKIYGGK